MHELKTVYVEPEGEDVEIEDLEGLDDDPELNNLINDEPALNIVDDNSELSLGEQLEKLAEEVIFKDFPGTPKERRLLRPAMIEALVEHEPIDRSEFVQCVPEYIRKSTDVDEARKYLDFVLGLIAGNEAEK